MPSNEREPNRLLFQRFPQLKERLAWMPLADLPTRVQRLDRLSDLVKADIWMKRDDENSSLYSGNKARKFEFIFAEAKAKGRTAVITSGSAGSNHGAATVVVGRKLGFDVLLVISPQPVLSYVRQNILVDLSQGAQMYAVNSNPATVLKILRLAFERRMKQGQWPYYMYFGGSSLVGTVGFVEAGLELAEQVKRGEMPMPAYVFVPTGSAGTHAGLEVGFRLAGLDTKVIGIRIVPKTMTNRFIVANIATRTAAMLHKLCFDFPAIKVKASEVTVLDGFFGCEYGRPTCACKEAIETLKKTEGLPLDPTYTGKGFAGMLDFIRSGKAEGKPVLYWQTLNSVDLKNYIDPDLKPASLPPILRKYFELELYDTDL